MIRVDEIEDDTVSQYLYLGILLRQERYPERDGKNRQACQLFSASLKG